MNDDPYDMNHRSAAELSKLATELGEIVETATHGEEISTLEVLTAIKAHPNGDALMNYLANEVRDVLRGGHA